MLQYHSSRSAGGLHFLHLPFAFTSEKERKKKWMDADQFHTGRPDSIIHHTNFPEAQTYQGKKKKKKKGTKKQKKSHI